MFEEGNILYFSPFYFKNGNTAKAKYFVVLKVVDGKTVLASLPTSGDFIPDFVEQDSGCIEMPDINVNCFVFLAGDKVTDCGKYFDFKTHIYGVQLDDYDIALMNEIYPIEGVSYELFGKMKEDLFEKLIYCLVNSKAVKRKYVRLLS